MSFLELNPDKFNGWDNKPKVVVESDGLYLICMDGTRQRLNFMEVLMYRAGCLNLQVLDRRYNSEPRRGC